MPLHPKKKKEYEPVEIKERSAAVLRDRGGAATKNVEISSDWLWRGLSVLF